jgi:hypothetical protein
MLVSSCHPLNSPRASRVAALSVVGSENGSLARMLASRTAMDATAACALGSVMGVSSLAKPVQCRAETCLTCGFSCRDDRI